MNACMKDTQQLAKPYTFNQRVENLFKSYFANHQNAKIKFSDAQIAIYFIDNKNSDSASLDLKKIDGLYQVIFWDGYSQYIFLYLSIKIAVPAPMVGSCQKF